MSLLVITLVLEMKVCSVKSLLAALAVAHMTLTLVHFWSGALCSGFLIQVAEVIEWGGKFNSSSICCRWSASEGSKLPSQGMNHMMIL